MVFPTKRISENFRRCPHCGNVIQVSEDPSESDLEAADEVWECRICGGLYEEKEEAEECCKGEIHD